MITINFEETFNPISIENDFYQMTFNSPQTNGENKRILVKISPHPDPLIMSELGMISIGIICFICNKQRCFWPII